MAHPLSSTPASIRLTTSTVPTVQTVDVDGVMQSALCVNRLADYPESTAVAGAVQSGVNLVVPAVGTDVSGVAPGATGTGTGYASATAVTKVTAGTQKTNTKLVSGSHVLRLSPLVPDTDLAVGGLVVGTNIPANAAVSATAAQPRTVALSITTTAASATVNLASGTTAGMRIGMVVTAPTVPAGYTVATIVSSTQFTLSSATSVTAGTAVAATASSVVASRRVLAITTTSASASVTVTSTAGLVAGQLISSSAFATGTTISSITSDTSFNASANASSSVTAENATFGALVTISHKDTNTTSVAASASVSDQTVSISPVIEMAANASTSTSATYTFVGNGRTMADMRDGDYCIIAVRVTSNTGYESYLMGYGYLRRSSSGLKQFYLWSQETGGSPITALTVPPEVNSLFWSLTDGPHIIGIFQKPKLDFAFGAWRGISPKLLAAPTLSRGAAPMVFPAQRIAARLLQAPALIGLDASQFITFAAQLITSRVRVAPDIRSIERDITFDSTQPPSLTSRLLQLPTMTGGYLRVSATARATVRAGVITINPHGENLVFRGDTPALTSRASGQLTGSNYFRRTPLVRALTRGSLDFAITGRGLSVRDVVADCFGVWNLRLGVRCLCAQDDIKERAIADLNAALQVIYARAKRLGYFNKKTLTVTVPANAESADLPNTIQAVLGTARWKATENATTTKALASLSSLADAQQFSDLYGVSGNPMAYFIDTRTQPEANVVKSRVMVLPIQSSQIYVDLEVADAAPRYTWRDVELATPLQLPSTYAESLLMPIVRQRATGFRLFTNTALRQTIEAQYMKAQLALGLIDPKPSQAAEPQTANVGGIEQ